MVDYEGNIIALGLLLVNIGAVLLIVDPFVDPEDWLLFATPARLWRTAAARWLLIYLCAFVIASLGAVVWEQILAWQGRGIAVDWSNARGMLVFTTLPYLAASFRISEDVDARWGIKWRVNVVSWPAIGRALRRAIGLFPVTVLAGWLGTELIIWSLIGSGRIGLVTRERWDVIGRWLQPPFGGYIVIALGSVVIGVVILLAWRLAVKFMTRNVAAGAGRKATLNTAAGFARGAFYLGCAAGMGALNFWYYSGPDMTAGGLLGPVVDNALWWFGNAIYWGLWAIALVLTVMGVREWWRTFGASGPGAPDGVHGRADFASEDEAAMVARGQRAADSTAGLNLNY